MDWTLAADTRQEALRCITYVLRQTAVGGVWNHSDSLERRRINEQEFMNV